jgi:phosphopentomutase
MAEASAGKDSVTGHWEMMGIVLDRPFPTFPGGFSADIIEEFSRRTGRAVIGNKAASGTAIIDELGPEHMRAGALIVYTSADSVFQIAAHEDVVSVAELYKACEIAYKLVGEGLGVGRVIARPFVGAAGQFKRTANRHDYALPPSGATLLDRLKSMGLPVVAIGKIRDLSRGRSRRRFTLRATAGAWTRWSGDVADRSRIDLCESGRLRRAVRPPQRRRGYAATSRHSMSGWLGRRRSCGRMICWS